MRVSIITMTSTYNYGATLQAFALQKSVESLGHSCEFIDHYRVCDNEHRKVNILDFSKENFLKIPYRRKLEKGYSNFELFYKEHMNMGKRKYKNDDELMLDPPMYDAYITGSDQVWNPRELKPKYYLKFAPERAKKISYAASLGVSNISDKDKKVMADYLKNMDAISVREKQGKQTIEPLTNKKVNLNCDPIFLLDREKWRSYEKPIERVQGEYLLCYMIYKPKWMNKWIREIKKKTNKKIIFVGLSGYRPVVHDKFIRTAGPSEFLWLIDHASGVITSSFHGAAFSIMFGKPLIAIPDPPRPARIRNLLETYGLSECELCECDNNFEFKEYDYRNIESKMRAFRDVSIRYLSDNLTNEE